MGRSVTNIYSPSTKKKISKQIESYTSQLSNRIRRLARANTLESPTKQINEQEEDPVSLKIDELIEVTKKAPFFRDEEDSFLIINHLNATDLIHKFRKEKITETALMSMMNVCSLYLQLKMLKKGETLFRIDDKGDSFYIIFQGKVGVLKPVETQHKHMTCLEFYEFMISLKNKGDKFLSQKIISRNKDIIPVLKDINDIEMIEKFRFKKKLINFLLATTKFEEIEHYFIKHQRKFSDFDLDEKKLKELFFPKKMEKRKTIISILSNFSDNNEELIENMDYDNQSPKKDFSKRSSLNSNSNYNFLAERKKSVFKSEPWMDYFKEKICIDDDDLAFENSLKMIETNKELYPVEIWENEKFMELKKGQYFGDFALDSKNKRRTATIIAETDCILGVIMDSIYDEYIFTEKHKIKSKEMSFIRDSYFFQLTKPTVFEKKYFHLFAPHEYHRNSELFNQSEEPRKLVLIKEGHVEISLYANIQELSDITRFIIDKILRNNLPKDGINTPELMTKLLELNQSSNLVLLKYSREYMDFITRKRKFQIFLFSGREVCCLEDIFLNLDRHLFKAVVTSEKAKTYEINVSDLSALLTVEQRCKGSYINFSNVKIVSLINRLWNLKKSYLDLFSSKDNFASTPKTTKIPLNNILFDSLKINYQAINKNIIIDNNSANDNDFKSKTTKLINFDENFLNNINTSAETIEYKSTENKSDLKNFQRNSMTLRCKTPKRFKYINKSQAKGKLDFEDKVLSKLKISFANYASLNNNLHFVNEFNNSKEINIADNKSGFFLTNNDKNCINPNSGAGVNIKRVNFNRSIMNEVVTQTNTHTENFYLNNTSILNTVSSIKYLPKITGHIKLNKKLQINKQLKNKLDMSSREKDLKDIKNTISPKTESLKKNNKGRNSKKSFTQAVNSLYVTESVEKSNSTSVFRITHKSIFQDFINSIQEKTLTKTYTKISLTPTNKQKK